MPRKPKEEIAEERISGFMEADKMEWERIISNSELRKAILVIQSKYGLPIPANRLFSWYGWEEPFDIDRQTGKLIFGELGQRREHLEEDVKKIAHIFNVPDKWVSSLDRMITLGGNFPDHLGAGFPSFQAIKENGRFKFECIITPETDLGNPLVLYIIKQWQANNKNEPPQPQKMRGNTRKLDWRPVWEWRKRHPGVTIEEIAKLLGRNRVTVNRALMSLDKAN